MAAGEVAVRVRGLRELQAALARADKQTRLGVQGELRRVAEPVQRGAEALARSEIRNIGPRWSRMRVGITRSLVYVAPRPRGLRGDEARKRRNLAPLLMDRAMQPALDRRHGEIEAEFGHMLDRVATDFNHGGGEDL